MGDMQAHLNTLRDDAASCAILAGEATDKEKRELLFKLSRHLNVLADQVEHTIAVHGDDAP